MQILEFARDALLLRAHRDERGAIGWLTIGIIIGVLLVIGGIIKFLIPGE